MNYLSMSTSILPSKNDDYWQIAEHSRAAHKPDDATEEKVAHDVFTWIESIWFRRANDVPFHCGNVATKLKIDK